MGYVRAKQESIQFEGGTVRATIKAVEYGDFLRIDQIAKEDLKHGVQIMAEIVKKYVTLDATPVAQDGTAVSLDEICTQAYFLDLLSDLFKAVMETGKVTNPLASAGSLPSISAATGSLPNNGAPLRLV